MKFKNNFVVYSDSKSLFEAFEKELKDLGYIFESNGVNPLRMLVKKEGYWIRGYGPGGKELKLENSWEEALKLASDSYKKLNIAKLNDFTVRVHTMEDKEFQEFEYGELTGISIGCEDSQQFYSKGALLLLQKICSKYGKVSVDLHGETFELDEALIENLLEMLND